MTDAVEIKYSMAELNHLIQRGDTCVTLQRKTRVVYLNPVQFSNIKSGIHDSLNCLIFKYDFFFKAIVLGYRKIKLLTKYGAFCYRSSKVSVQIEADFYLFNPEVGSKLLGVICKRSGHHLSVLVHKAFTVFLPLDENNYETGWDYAIGQDLEFEVASLDLTSGPLPYIKGKLIKEEKESDAREGEGIMVDAEGKGSYGSEWGGSDSGVASSPGRESEDSDDDNERKDVSEGSMKKSTIEEWTYKRPHHRKSDRGFGDELMKVMEKASEEESGVYSAKSLEKIDPYTAGETSSQEFLSPPSALKKRKSILKKKIVEPFSESESTTQSIEPCNTSCSGVTSSQDSGSEFPSSPPVPKKRKSILKVRKEVSCDTEVTSSYSAETSNNSLLTKTEETAMEASSASKSSKRRKSILKKPKEMISLEDDKAEEVKDKTAASDVDEGFKSPVKSKEAMGILELGDKSKSILRNIVKDISPMKYETESVKSILETLERSESESVTQDSVDSRKAVPKPKKRMSELKIKEVISSSDEEDAKESDSRNVVLETLGRMESKGVVENDGKGGNVDSLSEKPADEAKEAMEKSDSIKKKRKSLSKSKKRTSLLYESLAEKIRETTGGVNEENSGTSEKGSCNVSTPISKKVEQDSNLGSVTSPEVGKKKKTPKKKETLPPAAPEDLVKQLLQNMAMAIDADDVVKSLNVAGKVTDESSTLTEGKDMKESTSLKANVKIDSPKKTAGKRKSLPSKKEKLTVSVEDMIKRVTETIQSPFPEYGISPLEDADPLKAGKPNDNTEVQRRKSLDGASKKKSRKSVSNLTPIFEENKALDTKEPLKKVDETSLPSIEENEAESKTPSILDSAESSVTTLKKQRKSVGEKKLKKQKSQVGIDTPEAEKGDDQIERLLMLNKKMLGLDSMDASGDQRDKVSNEEKKSKKRKRESSGQKDSPKKRKALEADNADIPNIAGT